MIVGFHLRKLPLPISIYVVKEGLPPTMAPEWMTWAVLAAIIVSEMAMLCLSS